MPLMSPLLVCIYVAGGLHLLVASANIFAFGKFRYLEHLENVPPVVRQVFLVQNAYIMLAQAGFALLCFFFADELISGRPLSRALAGFLAVFWGSRVLLQLFYYDRELRRANRLFDVLFLVADGYLAAVFMVTALWWGRVEA
jgi:hypothetical protein